METNPNKNRLNSEKEYFIAHPLNALILICTNCKLTLCQIATLLDTFKTNKKLLDFVLDLLSENKFLKGKFHMYSGSNFYNLKSEISQIDESLASQVWGVNTTEEKEDLMVYRVDDPDYYKGKDFIETIPLNNIVFKYRLGYQTLQSWDINYLLTKFSHQHFEHLAENKNFKWDQVIIEKFNQKFSWNTWRTLSTRYDLLWRKYLLLKYEDYWHWDKIAKNISIPFEEELIICFKEKWRQESHSGNLWKFLLQNNSVIWTSSLVKFYLSEKKQLFSNENYKDLDLLTKNEGVVWSLEFLDIEYSYLKTNYSIASFLSIEIPWTCSLIELYKDKLHWPSLCSRSDIPWRDVIGNFGEYIDWKALSGNENIPWDINLICDFEDKINFDALSSNKKVKWHHSLLFYLKGKLNWQKICLNKGIFWDEKAIDLFNEKLWVYGFGRAENIVWSKSLFLRYEEKWLNKASYYIGKPCHDCPMEYNFYPPPICENFSAPITIYYIEKHLPSWEDEWNEFNSKVGRKKQKIEYKGKEYDLNNPVWDKLGWNQHLDDEILIHFKDFWGLKFLFNNYIIWTTKLIFSLGSCLDYSPGINDDYKLEKFWSSKKIFALFSSLVYSEEDLNYLISEIICPAISERIQKNW